IWPAGAADIGPGQAAANHPADPFELLALGTVASFELGPIAGAQLIRRRLLFSARVGAPVVSRVSGRSRGKAIPRTGHRVDLDSYVESVNDAHVVKVGLADTLGQSDLAESGGFGVERTAAGAVHGTHAARLAIAGVAAWRVFRAAARAWSGTAAIRLPACG